MYFFGVFLVFFLRERERVWRSFLISIFFLLSYYVEQLMLPLLLSFSGCKDPIRTWWIDFGEGEISFFFHYYHWATVDVDLNLIKCAVAVFHWVRWVLNFTFRWQVSGARCCVPVGQFRYSGGSNWNYDTVGGITQWSLQCDEIHWLNHEMDSNRVNG